MENTTKTSVTEDLILKHDAFDIYTGGGHYINQFRLFHAYFGTIPNLKTIDSIIDSKLRDYISKEMENEIQKEHYSQSYKYDTKKNDYSDYFIILKNNIVINLFHQNVYILFNPKQEKEAQGVLPLQTNSIQYKVIQELIKEDFDNIYDDNYSGEIADIITIKEYDNRLDIQFYHLKFAKDGLVNTRVDNFYEVCGQAQKSIHWKHKKGKEFFEHLLRRLIKTRSGEERSRLEKGTKPDLERLLTIAKNSKPMNFEVFIVQPSLSITNTSQSILTLLGVTENYLKEVGDINLKVIVNE